MTWKHNAEDHAKELPGSSPFPSAEQMGIGLPRLQNLPPNSDIGTIIKTMIENASETIEVELLAFQGGAIRPVTVPKDRLSGNLDEVLEAVFYYGQNDLHPLPNRCSVSVGDVVRYRGSRYLIAPFGFLNGLLQCAFSRIKHKVFSLWLLCIVKRQQIGKNSHFHIADFSVFPESEYSAFPKLVFWSEVAGHLISEQEQRAACQSDSRHFPGSGGRFRAAHTGRHFRRR
jgi:hypothetical protein